jgi:aminopeptidase YwaD
MRILQLLIPVLFLFSIPLTAQQTSDLAEALEQHVKILASPEFEGRGLGTDGVELAREYIVSEFESAGLQPIGADYFHDFRLRLGLAWVPAKNIIGKIPGNHPTLRDEYIVLGAHYDHQGYVIRDGEKIIYHGADDNASGVATLIELAKYFSQNRDLIGRTLVFVAFDAEESGLHGARRFVRDSILHPGDIKKMFSLDMVGMYDTYKGLDLKGIEGIEGGSELVRKIADQRDISIKAKGYEIERRTDTWPFGLAGIPSTHVFTGLVSPYHQPEDTYDLLEYEGMAKIKWFMAEVVTELSNAETLAPSREFESMTRQRTAGVVEIRRPFFNYGAVLHNGSGHHRYTDLYYRANRVYNFAAGFYTQFHLGNTVTIQPEFLYDFNGSQWSEGNFRRHSVTVPLNIQFNLVQEATDFRAYVFGGGYYRYHFAGKVDGESIDFDDQFREDEYGYSLGLGIEIMKVQVAWTVRRALSDIHREDGALGSIRDSNSYLSLGYRF